MRLSHLRLRRGMTLGLWEQWGSTGSNRVWVGRRGRLLEVETLW